MITRDDLRELAVLTALGAVVGLVHLALRPELPALAEPAPAACSLPEPEPVLASGEEAPMSVQPLCSVPPEDVP